MPDAPVRGSGITYRKAEQAEPHGGGGQGLLAFAAVLIAGMLFIGGALAIFLSAPRATATPTRVAGGESPDSTLPVFVQPTPTPSPFPSPSPLPTFLLSPTPGLSPGLTPDLSPSIPPSFLPTPTVPIVPTPTPTTTPTPTNTPTPTPTATPTATPVNCAQATGANTQSAFLGIGNDQSRGPLARAWCIHNVIIRPYLEFGTTRLLGDGEKIAGYTCSPGTCELEHPRPYSPPRLVPAGTTLTYQFTCADNPATVDVDECNDGIEGGATIEIRYEVVPGT